MCKEWKQKELVADKNARVKLYNCQPTTMLMDQSVAISHNVISPTFPWLPTHVTPYLPAWVLANANANANAFVNAFADISNALF